MCQDAILHARAIHLLDTACVIDLCTANLTQITVYLRMAMSATPVFEIVQLFTFRDAKEA